MKDRSKERTTNREEHIRKERTLASRERKDENVRTRKCSAKWN